MDFVIFVAGLVIGGLVSWLITHRYYVKAGDDQVKQLAALESRLKSKNTLQDFENLLESSVWHKEFIDHTEVWIADDDNTFQIELGQKSRQFKENWTDIYPDISMDGGRIFVPLPDHRLLDDESVEYFWNINSLEVKVSRVAGSYDIYNNMEGVAKRSKIKVVE